MLNKNTIYEGTINQIKNYIDQYPEERQDIDALISICNKKEDIFSRKTLPGHVTASAIIIKKSDTSQLLMLFHQSLLKWLQPGGHVDSGEYPQDAAIRELKEETDMNGQLHPFHKGRLFPIDIDIHHIPENLKKQEPAHYHYDFRYLISIDNENIRDNHEKNQVSWVSLDKIKNISLQRIFNKLKIT